MPSCPNSLSISVVIPAYNAAWCIEQAVLSVLKQTCAPLEILVVNDGSKDNTAEVVETIGGQVRLINQVNGGLSNARNTGIREARGDWIAFLDADDHWEPAKLEHQVAVLAANPNLGFCSTSARIVTPKGEVLSIWQCPWIEETPLRSIFATNSAIAGSGSAVIARRELLIEAGLFDESLRSLEDIDMWMRLAAISDYSCLDEVLTVILKNSDSMSRNLDVMRDAALRVMHKNRHLLDERSQGSFWRGAYATVLADFAKWEYRAGRRWPAVAHLLQGLVYAPLQRGRLLLSLLVAILLGQDISSNGSKHSSTVPFDG